jgi:diadenosine tetraphosphate (Ap4A) HIT family hydrolase
MLNCCFCQEFQSDEVNEEIKKRYGVTNRILFANDEFVVLPSVSPIVKHHLLILPKRHINTMKQLETDEKERLLVLMNNIMLLLGKDYFFFEHGAFPVNGNTCGVDHAHIHFLPVERTISRAIVESLYGFYVSRLYTDFTMSLNDEINMPYLSYGNNIYETYMCNNAFFQSQFMRKLLCNTLGINDWNWRSYTNGRFFRATISELRGKIHGTSL